MRSETLELKTPWRSALGPAALSIAFLAAAPPPPLFPQTFSRPSWAIQGFAAWREPSSSVLFGGIGFTKYWGVMGLRLGGALHLVPSNDASMPIQCDRFRCWHVDNGQNPFNVDVGAWMADAEVVFEPLRAIPTFRGLLLGFSPYGFAGIGGYGVRLSSGPDTSIATWSVGVGAHHDLIGPLGVQAEARYRSPLESNSGFAADWSQHLEYAVGLRVSLGGGGHKRSEPTAPPPSPPVRPQYDRSEEFAARVLEVAEGYLGTPYRQGGANPYGGFDAAGFVQYVFARVQPEFRREGARFPRTARELAEIGEDVPLRMGSIRPADLLFFASDGSHIDHVAIYAGHERVIHASASGGGVRYDVLGDGERGRWFSDHLVAARRVIGERAATTGTSRSSSVDPPDLAPAPYGGPR